MLKQEKHPINKNEPNGSLYSMGVVDFAVGGFGQEKVAMNKLQKIQADVKSLGGKCIPQAKLKRYNTAVATISLRPLISLNSAGRSLGLKRSTGERRLERIARRIISKIF